MKKDNFFAVIMAGGGGTRLWPLSRKSRPKQMLSLAEDQTLFEMAVSRLMGLFDYDHIYVVTVAEQAKALQQLCPEIPVENYLIEPMPRGTASVVGLAALAIKQRAEDGVMAILTADHFIQNVAYFHELLETGYDISQKRYLVTLGIEPTYPATGYGYIQQGTHLEKQAKIDAFLVESFKEKPDEKTAVNMLAQGGFSWNSGMFIWRVDHILSDFKAYMPELYGQLSEIDQAWRLGKQKETISVIWPQIKPETIDYGIMEKSDRVAVLSAENLGWNDVGSWDSLFEVLQSDEKCNIILGSNHVGLDSSGTLICSEKSDRLIVTIGVQDLVIVDTEDALLVCPREEAQKVREIVKLLKDTDKNQYL
jgi:mannose-1-phosphate guanylyltransferase